MIRFWPERNARRIKWLPIKPAPPVTSNVCSRTIPPLPYPASLSPYMYIQSLPYSSSNRTISSSPKQVPFCTFTIFNGRYRDYYFRTIPPGHSEKSNYETTEFNRKRRLVYRNRRARLLKVNFVSPQCLYSVSALRL